jgi:hypothetical protein
MSLDIELLPCPFCGGPVKLEEAQSTRSHIFGERRWWGVVCRNTMNRGGTCAIEQRPSASEEAAIERWNRRATPAPTKGALLVTLDSALAAIEHLNQSNSPGREVDALRMLVDVAPQAPTPAAAEGQAEAWQHLFFSVAQILHCLPSQLLDGNAHVLSQAQKAIAALKAAPLPRQAAVREVQHVLSVKHEGVMRLAAKAIHNRGHEGDARLADSLLGVLAHLKSAAPQPQEPK